MRDDPQATTGRNGMKTMKLTEGKLVMIAPEGEEQPTYPIYSLAIHSQL
jgi:hypothetical protein